MMRRRYVAEQLVRDSAGGPRLLAGRRGDRWVFPFPEGSEAGEFELTELPTRGSLWSFTIQRFQPKCPYVCAPGGFEPYAVGYVELPGVLIVETRIVVDDFASLHIGMPMQLIVQRAFVDVSGEEVFTYAFEPVARVAAAAGTS